MQPTPAASAVLACLADPTRAALLNTFTERGEVTASTLAALVPVSRQAIVKHLHLLERAGLVSSRRLGRERRYRAESVPLRATADWLIATADRWDTQLSLLTRAVEANPDPPAPHHRP